MLRNLQMQHGGSMAWLNFPEVNTDSSVSMMGSLTTQFFLKMTETKFLNYLWSINQVYNSLLFVGIGREIMGKRIKNVAEIEVVSKTYLIQKF